MWGDREISVQFEDKKLRGGMIGKRRSGVGEGGKRVMGGRGGGGGRGERKCFD